MNDWRQRRYFDDEGGHAGEEGDVGAVDHVVPTLLREQRPQPIDLICTPRSDPPTRDHTRQMRQGGSGEARCEQS